MTIPPALEMAVATAPTIPWSGAVCRRMVIEYDDVVAAMPHPTLTRRLRASHLTCGSDQPVGSLGAMPVSVRDNPAESRFEVYDDDALAGFAEYVLADGQISLTHTVVDDAFEGRGLAKELAEAALGQARERGLAVLPPCRFMLEVHPEQPRVARSRAGGPARRVRPLGPGQAARSASAFSTSPAIWSGVVAGP